MKQNIIFLIIFPIKNLNYFHRYHQFAEQTLVHGNKRKIWIIRLLILLNVMKALHFLFLAFYPLTAVQRIVHFEALYILLPKPAFNLIGVINQLLNICYFNYILFLNGNFRLNNLLLNILFKKDCSFFESPKCVKRGKYIPDLLRKYFLVLLNVFQSLVLVSGLY